MPAWATASPANWLGAHNAVGPGLAQAENDVIWSAPWPGTERTYFQIEVQSTVAQNMALRMLRYVALHGFRLWSDHGPPMPVVVPIEFYTGEDPWDASLETGELYAATPAAYRLLLRCEVVDRQYSERKDQSWAGKQS